LKKLLAYTSSVWRCNEPQRTQRTRRNEKFREFSAASQRNGISI